MKLLAHQYLCDPLFSCKGAQKRSMALAVVIEVLVLPSTDDDRAELKLHDMYTLRADK